MLFIVANGTWLILDNLYCVKFLSPIYLHNLSTTASFIVFILSVLTSIFLEVYMENEISKTKLISLSKKDFNYINKKITHKKRLNDC